MENKFKLNDRIVVISSDDKYYMQHGIVIKTGNQEIQVRLNSGIITWFCNSWVDYEK